MNNPHENILYTMFGICFDLEVSEGDFMENVTKLSPVPLTNSQREEI